MNADHTLDVAGIREAAEKATPGPWTWDSEGDSYMGCGEVFTWGEGVEGGNIAAPSGDLYPRSGYAPQADMKFIATMDPPTTLALLDALDAARAEVADLRKVVRTLADGWIRDLGHDQHAAQLLATLSTAKEALADKAGLCSCGGPPGSDWTECNNECGRRLLSNPTQGETK